MYLIFKDSLAKNGFWVIFIPMVLALIITAFCVIPKRNNPNYPIYYLFHPSKISKIIILIWIILMIGLFFFAQCKEYGFPIGTRCFKQIFNY